MRPADRAWAGLLAAVTVYEVVASRMRWELLSAAMDRYRGEHKVRDDYSELIRRGIDGGIVYLALHLTRRWPQRLDPLHRLAERLAR